MGATLPTTGAEGIEREFSIDELFFSTTDEKGRILAGNSVFSRVSAYSEEELIGAPHNVIRHPDVPRVVFQLLWDTLEAGRPIAAYVKNRAKDGRPYWVMATAVPVRGGYLSVRLKPSSAYFPAAQAVYRELLAVERAVEAGAAKGDAGRKRAIEASAARLPELLGAAGFPDYEAFMKAALPAEVRSREKLRARAVQPARTAGRHEAFFDACGALFRHLDRVFSNLDAYERLHETLGGKSAFVVDLAREIRLFALNAVIASARLDEGGATLGAVASLMRARSDRTAGLAHALSGDIEAAMQPLRDIAFMASVSRLQTETVLHFAAELAGAGAVAHAHAEASVTALAQCLDAGLGPLLTLLEEIGDRLDRVRRQVDGLARELKTLNALHAKGRIEATAASAGAEAFRILLARIQEQITAATVEMADFRDASTVRLLRSSRVDPDLAAQVERIAACAA